ncbi:MAG TPA: hypothetical protein VJ327_06305 [Patescibacteria group bacterium]|nr:hypothetical protein [Patescibacteria group bacterium]
MKNNKVFILILVLVISSLSCSLFFPPVSKQDYPATANAITTDVSAGLIETARAAATEQSTRFIETVQSQAAQDPYLQETAKALGTQVASESNAPSDIPIMEGEIKNLIASKELVSYLAPYALQEVVDFYGFEMLKNSWLPAEQGNELSEISAFLNFQKEGREARVSTQAIAPNQTTVWIEITQK